MLIDVEIAPDRAGNVDQRVAAELFDHVIEETDAGGDRVGPRAVEIDLDSDLRLAGVAFDPGSALGHEPRPIERKAGETRVA